MWPMNPKQLIRFAAIVSPFWQFPVLISIFYGNGTIQDTTDLVLAVVLSLLYSLWVTVVFAHHFMDHGERHERRQILSALPDQLKEQVLEALGQEMR